MTSVVPSIKGFAFKKNLPLLNQNGSLGIEVSTGIQPDVALALASDTAPFPARDIDLAEVALTASTPAPIEFARGAEKVSFSASGGVFGGFGVYRTGGALLQRLGDRAQDFSLDALEFGADGPIVLSVLRWGYNAEARANGAIALGAAGTATISVSGSSEGLFAVIRRLPAATPARDVLQATADSWIMPRQIASVDMVEPGTWIVAEVLGGITMTLGSQLGFDFNWVREAELGGLKGDIGLRLQMGINAAIGFSASGRCAVVVSRDTDARTLRLRFFRLRERGVEASFNATLTAQARDTLLPGKVDDFIAAVFDTHGQQILRDLRVLEKWTDPQKSLTQLLAEAGVDGAETLIARLAGTTPEHLQQSFDAVQGKAVAFIKQWHALPHRVSSVILKLVEEQVELADVRAVLAQLSQATPDALRALLDGRLARVDFFHTPAGRVLQAMAGESILNLLEKPLAEVQGIAARILDVLDGGAIEEVLQRFQRFVESELRLDRIFNVVTAADFAKVDQLLKRKLANFLGSRVASLEDLDKIRRAVRLLLDKREEYYEKAIEALHRKYNFALNAAYSSGKSQQALLDATFDFSLDPASVNSFFQQALQGNLDTLLTTQPRQVTLAQAALSHGVTRQAHVTVSLPFMTRAQAHLNESLATVQAIPDNGGLVFTLNASDTVASNERKGVLSLAMGLAGTGTDAAHVRLHQQSLELSYSLVYARRNMQTKHLRGVIAPAVETFFSRRIADAAEFAAVIDRQAEAAIPNGPNLLGNGLVSLEVSLSAAAAKIAGEAWLTLPPDRKAEVYGNLSRAIQASLKRNIHEGFFTSPDAYTDAIGTAEVILAYCALVPRATKAGGLKGLPYWNFVDGTERRAMLSKPQTLTMMTQLLARASVVLQGDGDAAFFNPREAKRILDRVSVDNGLLNSLLIAEADLVKHAFEAGLKIASAQNAEPSAAIKALATFGARLTQAFNSDVTALLGHGIQAIGTRVFLDASRAIDPARAAEIDEANAMLNIEFLKPDSPFDREALLAAGRVPARHLAFADRVVALGGG